MHCSIGASLNNISFTVTNEVNISFVLNCTSQGGPVNEMFWLHDNQPIKNSNHFPILTDGRMGVYFNTSNVYGQMIGRYSCKITNEFNDTLMEKEYRVDGNYYVDYLLTTLNFGIYMSLQFFNSH